jgi:hypothetical protein
MPLLRRMDMLCGKSGGMPLHQEFHYKPIFTWFMRTRFVLLMWWLLTWQKKTVAMNVISWPLGATAKLSAIIIIHKYRRFHEGHHFIPMAMEVHDTFRRDMNHFIKECVRLLHDRQSKGHLSLSFCIKFFKQRVNITL